MHADMKRLQNNKGFTFIEILVFTAIISFLFISMTSTVINALQRMQITEHRMYANRHAEELMEWLRAQKDTDWDEFRAKDTGNGSGTFYCFNQFAPGVPELDFAEVSPEWPTVTLENCEYDGVGNTPPLIFRRYALITAVPPEFEQVNVQIFVEWKEGNKYFSVPLNTVFTNIDENLPTPTP